MTLKFSFAVFGAALALCCARGTSERDSQIGRTTYDGSEDMVPASGTVAPAPAAAPKPNEVTTEPAPALDTIGQAEPEPANEPRVSESNAREAPQRTPDVIYVPTPQRVVDKMLELARVTKDDLVYDLGCGDGRIVVTAAKRYGARAVGFDIDPARVKEARPNVQKNKVVLGDQPVAGVTRDHVDLAGGDRRIHEIRLHRPLAAKGKPVGLPA